MGCLAAVLGLMFPRLTLILLWIFTPYVQQGAFRFWLWPLLGILFAPFTSLALVWAFNTEFGILQIIALIIGVSFDFGSTSNAERERRRRRRD
ncbi:MAG: hypothetical protein HUU03_03915 [Planctomycetaceae bacterium]|nr:hypothetical protein [Planctomycetota bacterium]MCQ3949886.1 hypothetical protein [Planctomycetota bacterium]NUO15567.1 hypothetical protein [Planctomycetaceae bacterium]GIK51801.1 MAG: hypothetical protein BroJett014_07740 [Planctomycetota bacterium]HRJ78339.1 hypothetical protein [Planctomycetota bacterium]